MLTSATPFDVVREHVEALMETGESFDTVERAIEMTRLPEDERAALWLLAWSLAGGGSPHRAESFRPALRPVPANGRM